MYMLFAIESYKFKYPDGSLLFPVQALIVFIEAISTNKLLGCSVFAFTRTKKFIYLKLMDKKLNLTEIAILKTMAYYNIFNYPLTADEIRSNIHYKNNGELINGSQLDSLIQKGMVFRFDRFYSLNDNYGEVEERVRGNKQAEKWMKKARYFSKLISWFPYVRGVSLSGSLSKGYLGEDPDIDYFIITEPGRLWLTRTSLVLFKRVFLANSHKYFCVNYFIDSQNLELEEKNIFTATELATLIPVYDEETKREFFEKNIWVRDFLPNFEIKEMTENVKSKPGLVKKFFEWFFDNGFGNYLDDYCMKKTTKHWSKKFKKKFSGDDFELTFKSGKEVSKHHPQNFQKYVLESYDKKIRELEVQFGLKLN
ncbi:MAG: nucleotidyltransferase domain-containing protein [Bacteroidetes bacterium]|nr:MAG: nucleotidyltransferase domain-containing protein [Bacteroidota bacterium]